MKTINLESCTVHICLDTAELGRRAAEEFFNLALRAIQDHQYFAVALSGGTTPLLLYKELTLSSYSNAIAWHQVHFFVGDERCLPADSEDNNFNQAKKHLFSKLPIPDTNLHPTSEQDVSPENSAYLYEQEIRHFFQVKGNEVPCFDLILLGVGIDGHCASLFPDTEALAESSRLVVANYVKKLKTTRITFTLPLLNNAAHVIFLAAGSEKSNTIAEILKSRTKNYPTQMIVPHKTKPEWFIDTTAGAKLLSIPKT